MNILKKIISIAVLESKNLSRSWFFRIFAIISFIILILVNTGLFVFPWTKRWMFYGLPSTIPYINFILFSIIQSIICIFMASDFLKYDYTLDITPTIYARSMTNTVYILGKTLGILLILIIINLLVGLVAFTYNYFFIKTEVLTKLYFFYPLIINLPAILFITGLTLIIMLLIRNQAITFLIVFSIIFILLIILNGKLNYIFDFTGFNLPLLYSDFIGIPDLKMLIIQRLIYLFAGTGFIFLSTILLNRLNQSKISYFLSIIIFLISIILSAVCIYLYSTKIFKSIELRKNIKTIIKKYKTKPLITIKNINLNVTQGFNKIKIKTDIKFINENDTQINTIFLSLNQGMKIKKISLNNKQINFKRKFNLIIIKPLIKIITNEIYNISIEYEGTIDNEACYFNISEEIRNAPNKLSFYNLGKKYSFINKNFVLLTPESNWYPISNINSSNYMMNNKIDFIKFKLTIQTQNNLVPISQGHLTKLKNNQYTFSPETLLPCISLIIGKYNKKTITIDGIEYSIYYLKKHDFFSENFKNSKKNIVEELKNSLLDFENKINIIYPYKRLNLIETPIQFYAYKRELTQSSDVTLPEQVLLPEKGLSIFSLDFNTSKQFYIMRMKSRKRKVDLERMQSRIIRSFFRDTLFSSGGQSFGQRILRRIGNENSSKIQTKLISLTVPNNTMTYSLFSLYYTYTHHFSSKKWKLFNTILENYILSKLDERRNMWRGFSSELTNQDKANISLSKYSFKEILNNPKLTDYFSEIIKLKGNILFYILNRDLDTTELDEYISFYLKKTKFKNKKAKNFIDFLEEKTGNSINKYNEIWLNKKQLPGYTIDYINCYEVLDFDQTKYQTYLEITNTENVSGIIKIELMSRNSSGRSGRNNNQKGGRQGRRGRMEISAKRIIEFDGQEKKLIGIVTDDRPYLISIDLLNSKNIPSLQSKRLEKPEQSDEELFNGDEILDLPAKNDAIIVDNEMPGFKIVSEKREGFILKYFTKNIVEEKYKHFSTNNPAKKWSYVIGANYFGTHKLSAVYKIKGKGKNKLIWETNIPEKGFYNVYFYVSTIRQRHWRRKKRDNKTPIIKDYNFVIKTGDGIENISVDLSKAEQGWFLIGDFYYLKGKTSITLSDKTNGKIILADAVKWVKKKVAQSRRERKEKGES